MNTRLPRQSNIELLRIVSIFFVLIGHAFGVVLGLPGAQDIETEPLDSFLRILLGAVALGGVNIFVLISGWFGIHPSKKGLAKYIYQVVFLLWGIYVAAMLSGKADLNIDGIKTSLGIYEGYWFVMAYLGMYLLSPVLNAFADHATKRQFQILLIGFYLFQCYYCWIMGMVNYFNGYSITFFCGLYLTARYVRFYPIPFIERKAWSIYIAITLFLAVAATIGIRFVGSPLKLLRYDNPLEIVACVCFLLGFLKIKLQNSGVNVLAKSCFAVYIIHFNPFVFPYFKMGVEWIDSNCNSEVFITAMFMYLIVVYLICSAIDSLRLLSWKIMLGKI